ncbi:MAG: hypothetical protein ABS77_01405 [Phenylobacterium sp. SCN 69-14]|nr:MAG: hypothetical protein ABS77_01405 [Phenylobacterium sp. SCN 69-14]
MAESAPSPRRTFLLETAPEADALLRVLAPFAALGARILALEAREAQGRTSIRIEAEGVGGEAGDHLAERLRRLPFVMQVGVVWRLEAAT